ncbi:MAG: hypothetical protein V3V00_15765 [Saprospiraceae bacterium]
MKTLNWKKDIVTNPTYDDFNKAWNVVFGYDFKKCTVEGSVFGLAIRTPGGLTVHGGFGFYTQTPRLENPDDIYYEGCGCDWDTDLEGNRYHKLDRSTGLPESKEAYPFEIIKRYIGNNKYNDSSFEILQACFED